MKYGQLTFGQAEAIVNKLGGMDGVKLFLSGKTIIENNEITFPIWRRISVGPQKDAEGLIDLLKRNCSLAEVGGLANYIIDDCDADIQNMVEESIELVNISPADLGFKNEVRYESIISKAKRFGLDICHPLIGPCLRINYLDQKEKEWMVIAMNYDNNFFTLYNYENILTLDAGDLQTKNIFPLDTRFIFQRRKKVDK